MVRLSALTVLALLVAAVQVLATQCRMIGAFGEEVAASVEEIGMLVDNLAVINAGHDDEEMRLTKEKLEDGSLSVTVRKQVVAGINFLFTVKGLVEKKALRVKCYRPLGKHPVLQFSDIEIVEHTS